MRTPMEPWIINKLQFEFHGLPGTIMKDVQLILAKWYHVPTSQWAIFVHLYSWLIRDEAKTYFVDQNQKVVLQKYGHTSMQTVKHKSCNPRYLTSESNSPPIRYATRHPSGDRSLYCIASWILLATGIRSGDGVEQIFISKHLGHYVNS